MRARVGFRFCVRSAIAVALTWGTAYAAAENESATGTVPAGDPPPISLPAVPSAESGTPATIDVQSLTGKELMQAPLAPNLSGQDAAIAASLRELLANHGQRFADRKNERAGLETFYRDRGFAPLWIAAGAPNERAQGAIAFLRGVAADGLDPADYPVPQFIRGSDPATLAEDELRLSQSILTFARHARTGRIHFTRVSSDIFYDLQYPDPAEVLTAMATAADVRQALDSYHPQHPGYRALKAKLAEARGVGSRKETRVRVPDGPTLDPGQEDMRVPILRRRLNLPHSDSWRYDDALVAAVKAFQKQAGLKPDGLVGSRTLARLNGENGGVRSDVIDTILANMERWRWMPRDLGTAYVVVNIPNYTLAVVDHGKQVWSTPIVVGKPKHATPLISDMMEYITLNPTWNVPPSIIRNEYLPVLQQDPGALARIGLKIGRNSDGSIRIYQPPGERNALGRIRFNFPNRFLVYQHDTPDKHLFARDTRAYSHGCMRVQNPDKYAEVLLSISQPGEHYTAERIRNMYGKGERTITLAHHIPVHLTYQTAFVDQAGHLQTRKDIYGHDAEILELLHGSERRVADAPARRKYTSNNKPVTARASGRSARYDRRYPRWFDPFEDRYDRRYAGRSYERRGLFDFFFFR